MLEYWLYEPSGISVSEETQIKSIVAWRNITRNPTVISFMNHENVAGDEQIVRIESDNRGSPVISASGQGVSRQVIIFGIRNHPTLPDTDIQSGYWFRLGLDTYTVIDVVRNLGDVQAIAEITR